MADPDSGWMTIEELSLQSGVTTRNIRAYQSRGLLPAPVSRHGERAAFYTPEHLTRLRLINRLQDRGFSLAGIADLLKAWAEGKTIEQVLGIESVMAEATEDRSRFVTQEEFASLAPPGRDPETALRQLVAVGLVEPHGEGYRIRYPKLFDLGLEALHAGVPLEELVDEFVRLRSELHGIAHRFVSLARTHVVDPFLKAGMPTERVPEIVELVRRTRMLAVEAIGASMHQAIADEVETAVQEFLTASQGAAYRRR